MIIIYFCIFKFEMNPKYLFEFSGPKFFKNIIWQICTDWTMDESYQVSRSLRKRDSKKYAESSASSDEDDEKDEEGGADPESGEVPPDATTTLNTTTIEKVLDHKKGEGEEVLYLIKWMRKAHIHNTWVLLQRCRYPIIFCKNIIWFWFIS